MKWTTTQLITVGAMGVIAFLLTLPGIVFSLVAKFPGSALIVAGFTGPIVGVITIFLLKKFGAATIFMFIYSMIVLPLEGGFLPIIPLGITVGLIADTVYLLFKNESKVAAAALGSITLTSLYIGYMLLTLWLLPPIGKLYLLTVSLIGFAVPVWIIIIMVSIIEGGIAGLVGRWIYLRLAKTAIVRRIQGE